jgi:hypothetical protein
MLRVVISAIIGIIAASTLTIDAEGHGVCAMSSCDTSPCPGVIKPCLAPTFPDLIRNQSDLIVIMSAILGTLALAFFAIRRYLQRKDFYVVR